MLFFNKGVFRMSNPPYYQKLFLKSSYIFKLILWNNPLVSRATLHTYLNVSTTQYNTLILVLFLSHFHVCGLSITLLEAFPVPKIEVILLEQKGKKKKRKKESVLFRGGCVWFYAKNSQSQRKIAANERMGERRGKGPNSSPLSVSLNLEPW